MSVVFSQENFATNKYLLVEVSTEGKTAGKGTKYFLPDIPELRFEKGFVLTNALQTYTSDQLTTSPNGKDVVAPAEIINAVLVLVTWNASSSEERLVRIPMFDLISQENGGYLRTLANLPVILPKCYVELQNATFTDGDAFLFGFHYFRAPKDYAKGKGIQLTTPKPVKKRKIRRSR